MARSAAALKPALVADATIPVAPLANFVIAKENPRTIRPREAIDALAANLAANGVLTPVICYEEGGKLHITCGGTRFLAAKQANLDGLPYDRRTSIKAIEAGLAEQEGHAPLHPADQARAFEAELTRECGRGTAQRDDVIRRIANRVGRTERFVEQRLRLASLHPPILKALREDVITVHQAEAWANADPDRQEELWRSKGKRAGELDPVVVKHLIDQLDIAATNRLAKFVGEADYRAAGGVIRQDLFAIDGVDKPVGHLDPELVKKLARVKLAVARKKLEAEGWGEVKATLAVSHMGYGEKAKPKTKEARARYGAHVSIDHNGKLVTVRGLRIKKVEKPDAGAKNIQPVNDWNSPEARKAREDHERALETAAQIVGRELFSHTSIALAVVMAAMARATFPRELGDGYGDLVSFDTYGGIDALHGLSSDKAWTDTHADLLKMLKPQAKRLEAFIANDIDDATRGRLLAYMVAKNFEVAESRNDPNERARETLAAVGRMVGAKVQRHMTAQLAPKCDVALISELIGETEAPKPTKKPRAKT